MSLQDDFTRQIKNNYRIIRKVCLIYGQTRDDREDLFQECLFNAWKAYPNFRKEAKFSTWLYKVALNTALYNKRKNKHAVMEVDLDLNRNAQEERTDHDQLAQLQYAIAKLNDIEKSIIMLFLDGLSYKEIGEIMGLTVSNVGVKLTRVKGKLKKIMTGDGF